VIATAINGTVANYQPAVATAIFQLISRTLIRDSGAKLFKKS
jgi:hypothetical protein